MEQHENAMTAYANGLVAEPLHVVMLDGLMEAMIKSPYGGEV